MDGNSERLVLALTLLLAGFIIVFVVLVLLIVIITIYGKLIQAAQGATAKRREKTKKVVVETEKLPEQKAPVVFGGSDDEIPGEIIAVIAANVRAIHVPLGDAQVLQKIQDRSDRNSTERKKNDGYFFSARQYNCRTV